MTNWKVIHLKPNTEKKFVQYCKSFQITCYIPMRTVTRVYQRRKIEVQLPVFTGYAFVNFTVQQRLTLLQSNCICRMIEPFAPRQFVRELVMVRRALRADPTLQATKSLEQGQLVRIINGPFMGTEGYVKSLADNMRVVLNIAAIGQALSINVSAEAVEPL
jgi:transcription antitermination factor NusG